MTRCRLKRLWPRYHLSGLFRLISLSDPILQTIQTDYTLGRRVRVDHYHVPIVRTPLTRNIAIRFSDIKDEIVTAFSELVPAKEDGPFAAHFYPAVR